AIRALRDLGVEPSIAVPEPNTWREVLSTLASQVELKGKRVAIQEYGVSNQELTAGLEARGARVTIVPVYRWTLPADRAPLRAALNAIAAGAADVAISPARTRSRTSFSSRRPRESATASSADSRAWRLARSDRYARSRFAPTGCAWTSSRSIRSSAIWLKRRRRKRLRF